jgi:hypothetical protein
MKDNPTALSLVLLCLFVLVNFVVIGALLRRMAREMADPSQVPELKADDSLRDVVIGEAEYVIEGSNDPHPSTGTVQGKYRQLFWITSILAADLWIIRQVWPWLL